MKNLKIELNLVMLLAIALLSLNLFSAGDAKYVEGHIKTLEVSEKTGKGQHSTTFAEMFDLPSSGKIIDTPGIRELGLVDISAGELSGYFPEMRIIKNNCKYNNCEHYNEPGCAVKEAVNEGIISEERYVSYLNIKDSIEEKTY